MKHKMLIAICLMAGILWLMNCSEPISPLSDITLDDPSVIKPIVFLSKSINAYGSVYYSITVSLYDKNNQLVTLKNGSVKCNDLTLTLNSSSSYFLGSSKERLIFPDSLYTITITLGNGDSYYAWIKTQECDLLTFQVPDSQNKNQSLKVSWTEVDKSGRYPQEIKFSYSWSNTNSIGNSHKTIKLTNIASGEFTIDKSYFNLIEGIYSVDMTLISTKNGALEETFLPGGSIVSQFTITKTLKVVS